MSDPVGLLKRAEKKGVPSSGFMKLFSGSDSYKFEEAADLCVQAATIYRLRKELNLAGDSFLKAADYQKKAGNEDEAGNTYVEAYKCFKSGGNSVNAVDSLENAIQIFTHRGQFRRGANFKFELGEILENDLHDYAKAIDCYELAGEWYAQDQSVALSNKCFIKCADLKALDGQYIEASDIYSKLIKSSMGNRLSQWSLKDYFLKKGLCQLAATDAVAAARTLQEGQSEDPNFADSRESNFLKSLIDAVNEGDSEQLSEHCKEFDNFMRLDKWKITILNKIKESIQQQEDDLL
ncbi:BAQ_1a_G0001590.mRNA.1.CDS.1 [Saccharomyces cerevisiae]|nr:BAQ_1a_G0001590.mRNA.1.CDS.1 [Saccharomyces cerevisiae]CAI4249280.1 BAM_G0001580.mRNA.1.CDS.1 [Saccharomyces cerevisiae]CAI7038388.1 BAM_G0001580.mRNA.1.CDS.1 [Saccharomyces cerevisiae]CAI7039242.1 BAQ_1a_G0001590.mRNA.1.CDS.1 [Saccharomyces cerevisiae]